MAKSFFESNTNGTFDFLKDHICAPPLKAGKYRMKIVRVREGFSYNRPAYIIDLKHEGAMYECAFTDYQNADRNINIKKQEMFLNAIDAIAEQKKLGIVSAAYVLAKLELDGDVDVWVDQNGRNNTFRFYEGTSVQSATTPEDATADDLS